MKYLFTIIFMAVLMVSGCRKYQQCTDPDTCPVPEPPKPVQIQQGK